jgi:hypothetical protein
MTVFYCCCLNAQNHLAENKAKLSLDYIKARIEQFRSQGLTEFTPSYITTVVPPRDNWHSKSMPKRLCAVCEQKAGKTCVKCKSAHYCCKEHQVCGVSTVFVTVLKQFLFSKVHVVHYRTDLHMKSHDLLAMQYCYALCSFLLPVVAIDRIRTLF